MKIKLRIDSELKKKLHIEVTEVSKCPRQFQYEYEGIPKLPSHYYAAKGTVMHVAVERALKQEPLTAEYNMLSDRDKNRISEEMFKAVLPEVSELYKNTAIWYSKTDKIIPSEKLTIEEPIEVYIEDLDAVVYGKPDLVTDRYIIDFKSGEKRLTREIKQQLAAYRWMYSLVDGKLRECIVVFLGGDRSSSEPVEVKIPSIELEFAFAEWYDALEKAVAFKRDAYRGLKVPCVLSFTCVFCPYRGHCRGV